MLVDTRLGPMGAEQIGNGQDVLLLHSLLTDRRVYDRILPTLVEQRRVTLIDLPGYGDSVTVEPHMDDLADAVGATIEELDLSPDLVIVGNGLGSLVSIAVGLQRPERVGRLILAGVTARFPASARDTFDRMATRAEVDGMAAVADTAIRRIFTEPYMRSNPDMVRERRDALARMHPTGFAAACRAIRDTDFTDRLAQIGAPTLVVVGSEDQATPPSDGRAVAASIPGAHYEELPGVAHGPQVQAPAEFLRAIDQRAPHLRHRHRDTCRCQPVSDPPRPHRGIRQCFSDNPAFHHPVLPRPYRTHRCLHSGTPPVKR